MKAITQIVVFFSVFFCTPAFIILGAALVTCTSYQEMVQGALNSDMVAVVLFLLGLLCAWYVVDTTDWDELFQDKPVPQDPKTRKEQPHEKQYRELYEDIF